METKTNTNIETYICDACGRHTGARGGRVLSHSDLRFLPSVVTCAASGAAL